VKLCPDFSNLLVIVVFIIIDLAAGRLSRNVIMSGTVLFNGKKRRPDAGVVSIFCKYAITRVQLDLQVL
jgi:hypothetical protein